MPNQTNASQTDSASLASTLYEHLTNHLNILENASYFEKSKHIPNHKHCLLFVDTQLFLYEYKRMFAMAQNQADSLEYLKSKNLCSYGDLLEMHKAIHQHIHFSNTNPEYNERLEIALLYDKYSPSRELQGPGRLFLSSLDFLPAIPWIPHSPNPEQPTIMGLMLSSTQAVLRNETFFLPRTPITHQDMMHLLVLTGTFLSGYARTTTGQPVARNYPFIDDSNAQPTNFLFDNFTVTNAIPFHPEYVLITGYPKIMPDPNSHKEEVKIIYNTLDPGRIMIIPPTGNEPGQSSELVSSPFTPDFLRAVHSSMF